MPDDRNAFHHGLTLLPPIVLAVTAGLVHNRFDPLTFNSESAFSALCFAFVISFIFSVRLVLTPRDSSSTSTWIAGINAAAVPLTAWQVAVGALAVGWFFGTIVALSDFWGAGVSSARLVLPGIVSGVALYFGRIQTRPTLIQRVWRLADGSPGGQKLDSIYRTARDRGDLTTLQAIAKMPRMSPNILEALGSHAEPSIRTDVANNPNTPPAMLLKLSQDKLPDVRRAVAFNSAANVELLRALSRDSNPSICEKAAQRLDELEVAQ